MASACALNAAPAAQRCNAWRPAQQQQAAGAAPSRRQHPRRRCRQTLVTSAALALAPPSGTVAIARAAPKLERAEQAVLDAIAGVQGRGKAGMSAEQQEAFEAAVAVLEADGGVPAPAASPLLDGRWRLLFTTRPGSASPIQRTFTAVDKFKIYQDIDLSGEEARVSQVVDFGASTGYLRVQAQASTDARPLPGFTPRSGEGLPFGIMGRSITTPPARRDLRVDFQFDQAAFHLKALPFTVPYPVPFRLLGDERKGFIDVSYLSPDGRLRLSRGNKGTLFVLSKEVTTKDRLLEALAARRRDDALIMQLAEELQAEGGGEAAPAASPLAVGTWRLVWTAQGERANPLQKALANQVENFQIVTEDGRLENLVKPLPGVRVRACAACGPEAGPLGDDTRTAVEIDQVVIELGSLQIPLSLQRDARGFVEWLYLDNDFRITRGNKGSVFLHTRDSAEAEEAA